MLNLIFNFFPLPLSLSARPVSYPENHYNMSPAGGDKVLPYRNPSASFSSPSSGLVGLASMGPPGITPGPFVRYKPSPDRCVFACMFETGRERLSMNSPLCRDKPNQGLRVTTDCLYAALKPSGPQCSCLFTCSQSTTNSRLQRRSLLCGGGASL